MLFKITLNNDMIHLIMLFSNVDINLLFFRTNHFAYHLNTAYYWKTKFTLHRLPILSFEFHQSYPSNTYEWVKEYRLVKNVLDKTNRLWENINIINYQSSIIGFIDMDDDLSWLPFYQDIKNIDEDYENHQLHFLIYRDVGTVNYHYYDNEDNIINVITYSLKPENSRLLVMSMLYHLPDICVSMD